jgi:RNA polymerase sigma factor (sigma-70 family)
MDMGLDTRNYPRKNKKISEFGFEGFRPSPARRVRYMELQIERVGTMEAGAEGTAPRIADLLVRRETKIRKFIQRRSGPHILKQTTVDDLYQQTVEAAIQWESRFEYRDEAGFMQWVHTIARRVICQVLVDGRRRPTGMRIRGACSTGAGISDSELPGFGRTPSSLAAGLENRASLERVMRDLPEHYRRVIELCMFEQRPFDEVAKELGRSRGAVYHVFNRAIKLLRDRLPQS